MTRVNDVPRDECLFIDYKTDTHYYSNESGHFSKQFFKKWNKRWNCYDMTEVCYKLEDAEWADAVKKFAHFNWA